nr:non-ribosomal peptide synthetase [Xenorhabdus lircayensis]
MPQLLAHTDPHQRRLDISQAPLFAANIAHDPIQNEWLLALNFHHLVSDHMTLELIIAEISELLHSDVKNSYSKNKHAENLPATLPYRHFVAQSLRVPASEHEAYFRDVLADVDEPTAPFGIRDVHSGDRQVTETTQSLDAALAEAIRTQARRQGVSPSVLFHVAWAQVLAKVSGRDDVVFGTVLLGRMQGGASIERSLGLFINTLPVRISLAGSSVRESVQAAYRGLTQLLEHEQAPLVLAQRCSGVIPPLPLFSSLFNYRHSQPAPSRTTWEGIRLLAAQERTNYPVTLSVDDLGEGFSLSAQTVSDIDPARLVAYMTTALTGLVEALDSDPQRPIVTLPILPVTEHQQLLVDFNATQRDFPQDALIHQLFEDQVQRTPDAIAVIFEAQSLSYRELNCQANRLAHHLIALGVRPDDRVAICAERSLAMVAGLLGILKAGGAYVPLDPAYPTERLAYMLENATPKVLLTQTTLVDLLTSPVPIVILDNPEPRFEAMPTDNPNTQIRGLTSRHLAYVIYTSGSTGQPKGVMVEHRNVNRLVINNPYADIGSNDCVAHCANVAFDASTWEIWSTLLNGGHLYIISPSVLLDPLRFRDSLVKGQVTALWLTTGLFNEYLDTLAPMFGQLRYLIVGGDVLDPQKIKQVQLTEIQPNHLINAYGPTETTTFATTYAITTPIDVSRSIPIGSPIANTQIYLLDTHSQPVPMGAFGEIYIGGAGVARGYLNRPELTTERFVSDPFSDTPEARLYKTGDLGRWLPDGHLEYLGRNDFQVKLRGFRIELGEIEAQLVQCYGVREAVVLAREDASGQKRLVAYLLPQADVELRPATLRQQLVQQLADYMLPSAFVTLDSFPLTPNGKLDRKALPAPDQAAIVTRGYEAPVGDMEMALAEIWQTLLALEQVGRHDHFFELGGHSLLAVQLTTRVRQALARELSLQQLFAHPVLADLAAVLNDASAAEHTVIPAANRNRSLPLSFAQQRLWFLAQLDTAASLAYHIPAVLRLSGQFNPAAFTAALDRLVARHESLRTHFGLVDEQPCQHIDAADTGFALSCQDLRSWEAAAQQQHIAERVERDMLTPFDFTHGPLIRGQLLQLADDEHILILTQHHIISDGWSVGILIRELGAFYRAALEGHDAPLRPLPIQYADYAVWQREWLQEEVLSAQRAFWREQLQGAPALLTLPTDRPRPSVQRFTGGQVPVHFDAELFTAIKALGQRQGTTLFMTLLAAWGIVLARLSGQNDIVIGTPVANRPHRELEGLIGFFVNTLPLRVETEHSQTVAELLAHVRERALAAYAHQDLPFEQLVETLQPERSLSYSAIFQVMLALDNTPDQHLALPGMSVSPVGHPRHSAHFDLTLALSETEEGLSGSLGYASDLFDRTTVERMVGYLTRVLTAMTADETQIIAHLPILSATERQQLLVEFNATQADFPQDVLIQQLFEAQVQRTPDALAVIFEAQSLSYAELNCRANRLAHHLIALGVRPDDHVALCVERGMDMIIGLFGILKAGGAYVPLDPAYPAERLAYMLNDAAPVAVLTQTALRHRLLSADPLISDMAVIAIDAITEKATASPANSDPQVPGLTARHLAYVLYTSGSTGQPKGAMVEHRNVVNLHTAMKAVLAVDRPCRITLNAGIVFDSSVKCWLQLLSGHTLVIVPESVRKDGPSLWRYFARHATTIFDCTPAQLTGLLDAGLTTDPDYQPQLALIGGEAIPPSVWSALQHAGQTRFINVYGLTECAVNNTTCPVDLSRGGPNIGRPLANTQIYLLDAGGQPVPLGVTGEIHIAGHGVGRGYLNRPELTAARFLPDPFSGAPEARLYKTGDLGRWRPDGHLEYLGRNDFQVKLRGFRIELGEIEAQLVQCPGVRKAVVLAREDAAGQKRLVAYLLAEPKAELVPATLRQQLAQHLADYMLPSAFVTLDAFPLTFNGKLDRQALPAPDQSAVATRGYAPPIGQVEMALAQIWQALLNLEQVGRHDHFFELGGHSLIAVQLITRLRQQDMEVSLATLFTHPTLRELALAIGERTSQPVPVFDTNPVPLKPAGNLPPLFFIHEPSGDPLVYSPLAALLPTDLPVYALQALGIHTLPHPPASIEELAACHIQAIRRVQPHGPYHLAGWSMGGVIAYEIAQQLINSNEQVAFIGMIDSVNPCKQKISLDAPVDETQKRINMVVDFLQAPLTDTDGQALEELRLLDDVDQVFERCVEYQWLPADVTREDFFLRLDTAETIRQLGAAYIPPASSLPIHLYAADKSFDGDEWRGWQGIVGDTSMIHPIGGTHHTIMQPPLLNQMADSMTELLLPTSTYDPLVIIQSGSQAHSPLFCMPGAGASASSLLELALSFPSSLPVYVLQSRGLTDPQLPPHISVEGTARDYIKTIRQIQPEGPYHLLGHSFGGWIAFEIALQLQAEGEQVADIILIDSEAPDPQGCVPKSLNRIETLMKLIEIYNMILSEPLPLTRQDFEGKDHSEQLQYLHQALVRAGLFTAHSPISLLQGVVQVMQANLNTCYTPRTRYNGHVHLINAKEGDIEETRTHANQWKAYDAQLSTMLVSGNHMTMLSIPNVEPFVTELWQKLDYIKD